MIDVDGRNINIKFNAAVGVTALAVALLIAAAGGRYRKVSVRALALLVLSISLTTLFQQISGVDVGIDSLVFEEPEGAFATSAPGRMGIPASLTLTLLALALGLAGSSRTRWYSHVLSTISLCLTGFVLAGYLFGASQFYSIPLYTGIALQTAALLALVAVGTSCLTPEYGLIEALNRRDRGGQMFRLTLLPTAAVCLLVGFVFAYLFRNGYLDAPFGVAARTVVEIILMTSLLLWVSRYISLSELRGAEIRHARTETESHRRVAEAQESERRRISQDLHDHIGQRLTALRFALEGVRQASADIPEVMAATDRVREQAKLLDSEVSMLAWQIRPGVLDQDGLSAALRNFAQDWSATHGIQVRFRSNMDGHRLPANTETNVYRIVQEALNNIAKHARASNVSLTLTAVDGEASVAIEDDGIGFDPDSDTIRASESGGLGLAGMRERAAVVKGTLEIESSPGNGTAILVRVPRPHE